MAVASAGPYVKICTSLQTNNHASSSQLNFKETGSPFWCPTIGANLYVTMVTCHHHFWKWWWLSPPLFQSVLCNFSSNSKFHNIAIPIFPYTFGKRIVFFLLPEAFSWPKICKKCDSGAGELTMFPQTPVVGWGADTPRTSPHSAPLAPRCSRLDRRAPLLTLTPNPGDAIGHHHFLR